MKKLVLKSSLCKKCGACCYTCGYLGSNGCTHPSFLKNSRCVSYPVLYGNPPKMGYKDLLTPANDKQEYWFIAFEEKCLMLQHEQLRNSLKRALEMVNDGKSFSTVFFQFEDGDLLISQR